MPARYTDKIYDILQRENPELNLSTIKGIREASKVSLFTPEMLELIEEQHRDAFTAGFTLHYLQDEIGYPTFSAWQIALLEKLVNNHDYINLIYNNLDKQIFSNYRIHKGNNEHTDHVVTTPNLTDETTYGSTSQNTQSGKIVNEGATAGETSNTSNIGKTQTQNDGNSKTDATNTHTSEGTVESTSHDTQTANGQTSNTGTVKTADTRNDTQTKAEHSTDVTGQAGTKTTANSGNVTTTDHGAQDGKNWQHFSNTPQNRLQDVENGQYLTNATYTGNESKAYTDRVNTGESSTVESFNNYQTTSEHTAEADRNKLTTNSNGTNTRTDDTRATTTNSQTGDARGTQSTHNNATDTNTQTNTQTGTQTTEQLKDATATGSSSGTSKNTTDYQDLTNTAQKSGTDTTTHKGNTTADRNGVDTQTAETYEVSMSMLLQAEPLMSKLWHLFDDLFMMVYDTYNYWD